MTRRAGGYPQCVITGDLDRALATTVSSAGTWRPAPPGTACAPRTYSTTIAFRLARGHADDPVTIAAGLAGRLGGLDWVEEAAVTGGGYLTVRITADTLACLAVRMTQAGPGCDRSSALAGTSLTVPAAAGLASAHTWEEARRRVHAAVTASLAEAAGAQVKHPHGAERIAPPGPSPLVTLPSPVLAPFGESSPSPVTASSRGTTPTPVAEAIAYAGTDAITCALARLPPWGPAAVDARLAAAHHLGSPAYAVRYAHAHAASALRQAADLGLDRGEAAGFRPRLLAHPREQALLGELSWLPERVARAARRRRSDVLAHYLEGLALAYFDCQEACPAVQPGTGQPGTGRADAGPPGQPGGPATEVIQARLWLAAAAETALRAGLGRLGVDAPDRL
jgi:arginyl-tRNA synthetase